MKDELREQAERVRTGLSKRTRTTKRALQDFAHPPSTLEQINRVVSDFWNDDVKPIINRADREIGKMTEGIKKEMDQLIQSSETAQNIVAGFNELAEKVSRATKKSPILNKLGDFIKKTGQLIKSIAGTEKDRSRAWNNLKKAGIALTSEIKKAITGKQKSTGMAR